MALAGRETGRHGFSRKGRQAGMALAGRETGRHGFSRKGDRQAWL